MKTPVPGFPPAVGEEPLRFDAPPWVHLWLVVAGLGTAWAAGFIYLGPLVPGLAVGTGALAWGLWLNTTYRRPARRALYPLYIAGLLAWLVHALELWAGGYPTVLTGWFPRVFAAPVLFDGDRFVTVFILAAAVGFLYGALGFFLHHPLGNYMAWFLFCWLVVEALSLVVLPWFALGRPAWAPGLWSAPLTLAVGAYGMVRLRGESRIAEVSP